MGNAATGEADADADAEGGEEGIGAPEGGSDKDDTAPASFDQRLTRPEPMEQAFGSQAHSAEPTAADPSNGPDPVDHASGPGGSGEPQ
jgi:hypothetical protein